MITMHTRRYWTCISYSNSILAIPGVEEADESVIGDEIAAGPSEKFSLSFDFLACLEKRIKYVML